MVVEIHLKEAILPDTWWEWLVSTYLTVGVVVFFLLAMNGYIRYGPWSAFWAMLIWPRTALKAIRERGA